MTNFLKKKLIGTPEDKARKQQLKQDMDAARWEARRKGSIERARKEGYRQGRQGGGITLAGLANIGNAPVFENPFETGPQKRHSKRNKRRRENDFPF